jgi:hypothetical protein
LVSPTPQRWCSAWHTGSSVLAGLFPAPPLRMLGHEPHHQQAQDQVPPQGHIVASLEVPEAHHRLADATALLHVLVAVKAILRRSRSSRVGDGKVFVVPLGDCVRIRNWERGMAAVFR